MSGRATIDFCGEAGQVLPFAALEQGAENLKTGQYRTFFSYQLGTDYALTK